MTILEAAGVDAGKSTRHTLVHTTTRLLFHSDTVLLLQIYPQRVRRAGQLPPAEVLGAHGETEEFGGIGVVEGEVFGALCGVMELVRGLLPVDCDFLGILGVCTVDLLESFGVRGYHLQVNGIECHLAPRNSNSFIIII